VTTNGHEENLGLQQAKVLDRATLSFTNEAGSSESRERAATASASTRRAEGEFSTPRSGLVGIDGAGKRKKEGEE